MKNVIAKLLIVALASSLAGLVLIMQFTTPTKAGAIGILTVFIMGYIAVVSSLSFLLFTIGKIISTASRLLAVHKPIEPMSLKRAYYFSSVIGLAPVIIVGMQSVGSLGLYEITLVLLFILIGCVYVAKRTA